MATFYGIESVGVLDGTLLPAKLGDAAVINATQQVYKATIDMSATTLTTGDLVVLGRPMPKQRFISGQIISDTSFGTSTVQIGTLVDPNAYRLDAVFTAVNSPENFATIAGIDADVFDGVKDIILTVGTANMPTSGKFVVLLTVTHV